MLGVSRALARVDLRVLLGAVALSAVFVPASCKSDARPPGAASGANGGEGGSDDGGEGGNAGEGGASGNAGTGAGGMAGEGAASGQGGTSGMAGEGSGGSSTGGSGGTSGDGAGGTGATGGSAGSGAGECPAEDEKGCLGSRSFLPELVTFSGETPSELAATLNALATDDIQKPLGVNFILGADGTGRFSALALLGEVGPDDQIDYMFEWKDKHLSVPRPTGDVKPTTGGVTTVKKQSHGRIRLFNPSIDSIFLPLEKIGIDATWRGVPGNMCTGIKAELTATLVAFDDMDQVQVKDVVLGLPDPDSTVGDLILASGGDPTADGWPIRFSFEASCGFIDLGFGQPEPSEYGEAK